MIKRRIAWGIIIIAAGIAYLFSNETVTLALLIACVAVPLFSGIMLAASGRKLKIRLETSGESEAGSFRVIIENGSILPVSGAQVETACSNLRTGEVQKAAAEGYVKAKGETKIPVNIVPVHSGRYEMSIGDVFLYDPLKLFRKKAEAEGKAGFTFAKDLFDTELKIVSSSSAILESDRYARNRQGNDPGEVRSIKEYAPGDPVKNIHWKLSEKTDKVLVKELSLPVTDDLLLILDTGAGEKQSFEAMDACAVVYGSMIGSLLREGMDFSIGWTDPAEGGVLVTRKILSEKDAAAAADEYLAVPVSDGETFPILENVMQNSRFAHLAIVGSTVPPGIAGMASGCQVSALVCGYSGSMSSEGIRIIGFPEAGYETDLAVVEI